MMRRMDTLLLIEDDHRLAQMVSEYLQQSGFAVHHAPTAEAGLLALSAHTPSLVLLDLMLPDGDGLDFCRQFVGGHRPTGQNATATSLGNTGDQLMVGK